MMEKDRDHVTESILNLTLEIIYLLTGEGYTVMKNSGGHVIPDRSIGVLGEWNKTNSSSTVLQPDSLKPKRNNDLKILKLTKKIIQLLTGEGKDLNDVEGQRSVMGDQQCPEHKTPAHISTVESTRSTAEERLFSSSHCKIENHNFQKDSSGAHTITGEDLRVVEVLEVEEQRSVIRDQRCLEGKIPAHCSTVENSTINTREERSFTSSDCKMETHNFQRESSGAHTTTGEDLIDYKVEVVEEEQRFVGSEQQCMEPNIPAHISTGENSTRNALVEQSFSSSYPISENHGFQPVASGAQTFTVNVPLVLAGVAVPLEVYKERYCPKRASYATQSRAPMGDKLFSCSDCDKSFTKRTDLSKHQRTHNGEKTFPCPECGKLFTKKSNLVQHERIHTGEKPFKCSECDKCFAHKSNLFAHQATHATNRPFPCSECEKSFTFNSDLVRHQKTHNRKQPFICPQCGKPFAQKSSLVKHQSTHSDEKPVATL